MRVAEARSAAETTPGGLVAVVAEKPSVARDIAAVLGAAKRGAGCLIGAGHIVTWAIGHLVALPEPHQVRAEWKSWRREHLPMLPEAWPLVVMDRVRDQFEGSIGSNSRRQAFHAGLIWCGSGSATRWPIAQVTMCPAPIRNSPTHSTRASFMTIFGQARFFL